MRYLHIIAIIGIIIEIILLAVFVGLAGYKLVEAICQLGL